MPVQLFISAATEEFSTLREDLHKGLNRHNVNIHIQQGFVAGGRETLDKLDTYIKSSDAVVHLVGTATGAVANASSVAYLNVQYPELSQKYPALSDGLVGKAHYNYTQWEAYLGWHHGKTTVVAIPEGLVQTNAVKEHLERLRSMGRYPEIHFKNTEDLCAQILQSTIFDLLVQAGHAHKPLSLPYQTIGTLFKGRQAEMEKLRATLLDSGSNTAKAAITGTALHGLGGIGKTRLAVEYALAHEDRYTALLFVKAEKPEDLKRNIAALCGEFRLKEAHETEQEAQYQAAVAWLQRNPGWFMVLDNVDTAAARDEAEKLFAKLRGGHVIITSRLSNWGQDVEPLELDVLSVDTAADYLVERTDGKRRKEADDAGMARTLAKELGQLALALQQAGAYIAAKRLSFSDYQRHWQTQHEKVLEWFDEHNMKYHHSVAVTWKTSYDELNKEGKRLLDRLAWLAPDPVPESLLEEEATGAEPLDAWTALECLEKYSLVTRDIDGRTFTMHRLVQDVGRLWQEERTDEEGLRESLHWINVAFQGDPRDFRNWPKLEALYPHAAALAGFGEKRNIGGPLSRLMNQAAQLLDAKAQYTEAEPLIRRALDIDEKAYGPNHPDVAIHLNNLAGLLQATNRMGDAEPLMRRALDIDEKAYGPNHPNVAIRLNNLAHLLQATNRMGDAEPLMRRALDIDEKAYGPNHPKVAIRLNNLAHLLQATNRMGDAEPLMRRALDIDEKAYGPNHPNVATHLNNLANLLQATNRMGDAEPLMRRALDIDEKAYGPNHPKVAIRLNNLAGLLQATNRMGDAEPLMRRALDIDEKAYGPNHPDVAIDLNNLAGLLQATNRMGDAEPLMRRALDIDEKAYGPNHPDVAIDLNNLANLLQTTNRMGDAEPLMRRALDIDEKAYGPNHPNVAIRLNNLAGLLQATNRMGDAEPLMRRALDIDEKAYGPNHPNVAIHLNNLAHLLQATNRMGDAEPLMRRALDIDEKAYGPNHPNVAIRLNNLAHLLQATNRMGDAEPLMRRALDIDEKAYGPNHPNVAIHLNNLAHLLQATNRMGDAEPLMRRALDIDEKAYGPNHPNVAIRLNNLAHLLQATNRMGDAEPLMRRHLEIFARFNFVTGHTHPHFNAAIANYQYLLQTMGLSSVETTAKIHLVIAEATHRA